MSQLPIMVSKQGYLAQRLRSLIEFSDCLQLIQDTLPRETSGLCWWTGRGLRQREETRQKSCGREVGWGKWGTLSSWRCLRKIQVEADACRLGAHGQLRETPIPWEQPFRASREELTMSIHSREGQGLRMFKQGPQMTASPSSWKASVQFRSCP